MLGGDDFDALPGFQRRIERHQMTIDLGAPAAVAEIGMHAVGEVDRRRPLAADRPPCPAA
jgi:hypothetical protein